ncbi:hypothetical protein QBC39DRAFT_302500 [Podospora conica]|nr:hypothetical protein QBC39DRAFT_302500 [Schizothecium conicum]
MVSTRSSSAALLTPRGGRSSSPPASMSSPTKARAPRTTTTTIPAWSHAPTTLTLGWLFLSLPLVLWDMGYVLLRPHSMPGGKWHWPVWAPYAIQCELDWTYGWKEWNAGGGWNTAQTVVNGLETAGYLGYLWIWWANARAAEGKGNGAVTGRAAALAVLVGYSAFLTTFVKTVLYWLNEAFSGFANIGHNEPVHLFVFWVIPNGAWIVFPGILVYKFGDEIINGLTKAASGTTRGVKSE